MLILLSALLLVLIFGAITLFGHHYYVKPGRMLDRLVTSQSGLEPSLAKPRPQRKTAFARFLEPVGNLIPISAQDASLQKQELIAAGIRSPNAVRIVYGAKLVLSLLLLVIALALRGRIANPILALVFPIAACGVGFALPGFIVGRKIQRRSDQVRLSLPDVLDLMVICTEAGCGLDQAMINVSRELKTVHPAVSEELSLVNLEIMAGKSRSEALRNFAQRSGEDELKKIVAILVQTDRFGTSVADALRTQSDYLRVRRRQEAEERAGKVGVKLVFPIFFFCLPSLLVVTAGPGILQLIRNMGSIGGSAQ